MSDTAIRRTVSIEITPEEIGDVFVNFSSEDQVTAIFAALDGLNSIGPQPCEQQILWIAEVLQKRATKRHRELIATLAAFFSGAA